VGRLPEGRVSARGRKPGDFDERALVERSIFRGLEVGARKGLVMPPKVILCAVFAACAAVFSACSLYEYGEIGGADKTDTYTPGDALFESVLSGYAGIWYSRYAGMGRLDSYRIGKVRDFTAWGREKAGALFPAANLDVITTYKGYTASLDDYILLYDDTVYGQNDGGEGGNGGWNFCYIGIVRDLNVFNKDPKRGAIVIEYIQGCAPKWLDRWPESANGARPFFGVFYREIDANTVQMANAVNLAALYAGKRYYTEKPTLPEAIAGNSVENEAEYISWGVVIPQSRER
jgi:hypothetical protein